MLCKGHRSKQLVESHPRIALSPVRPLSGEGTKNFKDSSTNMTYTKMYMTKKPAKIRSRSDYARGTLAH